MSQMQIRTIGLMSPGDMGQAVALRLKELGFVVGTALDGRSPRTRALAAEAGLTDFGDIAGLVAASDLVLSIVDPGAGMALVEQTAAALARAPKPVLFADCNALSPQTKLAMQAKLESAGAHFIDGAIIGPPPRGNGRIRLYASGEHAAVMGALEHADIAVRIVSPRVGEAAAVKMCYGAVTKGTVALLTEMLVTAQRLGVEEVLAEELRGSQSALNDWILRNLPSMPPKAYRWVPETEEIAATFAAAGLTPKMMQGAAEIYRGIAATELGRESPEAARDTGRKGEGVIAALAGTLPGK